jgi:hypothetical protein
MLNKNKLKKEIQDIFDDLSDTDISNRMKDIGNAIVSYLEEAAVGIPPAGTASSVTFPGASAIPSLLQMQAPPASAVSASLFVSAIINAVTIGSVASIGGMDGAPISPGIQIVSEIGMPPIVPVILMPFPEDQTSSDAAEAIAEAIHQSIGTILFNVIVMVPTPAGPVPTPIPGIQIK